MSEYIIPEIEYHMSVPNWLIAIITVDLCPFLDADNHYWLNLIIITCYCRSSIDILTYIFLNAYLPDYFLSKTVSLPLYLWSFLDIFFTTQAYLWHITPKLIIVIRTTIALSIAKSLNLNNPYFCLSKNNPI